MTNSIPEIIPPFITPLSQRGGEEALCSHKFPAPLVNSSDPKKPKIEELSGVCAIFQDTTTAYALIEILNLTSRASFLSRAPAALPYLQLPFFPLFFYQGLHGVYTRVSLMIAAIKVRSLAVAFFYFLQGLDMVGGLLCTLSKSASGIVALAGANHYALTGFIFTLVVPKLFMIAAVVGAVAQAGACMKVHSAVHEFQNKKGLLQKPEEKQLQELLDFLYGPLHATDQKLHLVEEEALKQKIHEEEHLLRCFRNTAHRWAFRDQVDTLYAEYTQKIQQRLGVSPSNNPLAGVLLSTSELFQEFLHPHASDPFQLIDKALANCKQLAQEGIQVDTIEQDLLSIQQEFLDKGSKLLSLGESHLYKQLYSQILLLLAALLNLIAAYLLLEDPSHTQVPYILLLSSSIVTLTSLYYDTKQVH